MKAAASEPRQVLEQIDELLQALGTSDADLFPHYDSAWSEWLNRVRRPLRVWKLADPRPRNPLVDITVTATK
jgi:hypothetical protein